MRIIVKLIFISFMAFTVSGGATENVNLMFLSEGRIQLNGDSTFKKYSSTAKIFQMNGTAINKPQLDAGLPWTPTEVAMVLNIKNLKSGDDTLDEHMQENLKFDKYPEIQLKISSFSFTKAEDKNTLVAVGTLSVAGVTKPIELMTNLKVDGENVKISGVKKILMSDYGITPPKMMMGTIKTSDDIEINFEVVCSINNKKG